jgi:hypothetical protein
MPDLPLYHTTASMSGLTVIVRHGFGSPLIITNPFDHLTVLPMAWPVRGCLRDVGIG